MDNPSAIENAPTSLSGPTSLAELARLFLRLGVTAFGGPAAHIAMMEEEVVRRRQWLTHAQFLDLLGAANLIPGPNSTEMAIHIGYRRAGLPGLIVAGACFILPAAVMVAVLAAIYVRVGNLPQVAGILYGVKPVIIAVVLQALWKLGRTAVKTKFLGMMGLLAVMLSFLSVNPLPILFGTGLLAAGEYGFVQKRERNLKPLLLLAVLGAILLFGPLALTSRAAATAAAKFGLPGLFLTFLKIGSVLYGSGYVLLAFLRDDFVTRLHWLTSAQLLDAVAVGQVTPGPVFTTATFIGYVLGGPAGAAAATVGIFLPAFVFVGLSGPLIARLRQSPAAGAFLDGVNIASLALMAVVTWQLSRAALIDLPTCLLAILSAVLLLRFRVNSVWLVLGGALVGLLASLFRTHF